MVNALILTFLEWKKEFHIHTNASRIDLGVILYQLREGNMDHLVYFVSKTLSQVECNCMTA